jgi:hypothetical protein
MAAVAMETVSVCQNLWPHLYRKPPKGFPQNLAYILRRVGRIFWPKKNRERMAAIFKMAADKIGKISMFSDFNENLYLGLFWSEELIGNDENCIRGHFYFQNGRQQNRQNFKVLWFQWKLISRVILKWGIHHYQWWKLHSGSFLFSKWPPTKSAKLHCSLISMKIDI